MKWTGRVEGLGEPTTFIANDLDAALATALRIINEQSGLTTASLRVSPEEVEGNRQWHIAFNDVALCKIMRMDVRDLDPTGEFATDCDRDRNEDRALAARAWMQTAREHDPLG